MTLFPYSKEIYMVKHTKHNCVYYIDGYVTIFNQCKIEKKIKI